MAKPILSLKKKKPEVIEPEEILVNPIASIEVDVWDIPYGDYALYADFAVEQPRQRRRRKDKYVEQYRKESKWQ